MAGLFVVSPAYAETYYLTDSPAGADYWVIVTDASGPADCWIFSGDIISSPSTSVTWLFPTDSAGAADKWIVITDNPKLADPPGCLEE